MKIFLRGVKANCERIRGRLPYRLKVLRKRVDRHSLEFSPTCSILAHSKVGCEVPLAIKQPRQLTFRVDFRAAVFAADGRQQVSWTIFGGSATCKAHAGLCRSSLPVVYHVTATLCCVGLWETD